MNELLTEIQKTIAMLGGEIPANPATSRNEKLANSAERDLAEYFKALETAMPWEAIEQVYYKNVREE